MISRLRAFESRLPMKLKLAVLALAAFVVLLSGRAVIGKYRLAGGEGRTVYKASRMLAESAVDVPAPAADTRPLAPPDLRLRAAFACVESSLPASPLRELRHAPPRASPFVRG